MTVAELIERLSAFPSDLIVVARGYEEGYDDVIGARVEVVVDTQGPGEKSEWWTGRYDDADYSHGKPLSVVSIE